MHVEFPCRKLYPKVSVVSIPTGHLLAGIDRSIIRDMDKYEIRRRKVEELIRDRCGGVHAKFAEKIERSPSYVGRMLYPEGKPGKKNISDTLIDVIEQKFELPRGWLDGIRPEIQADVEQPQQSKESTLTNEQKQFLSLLNGIRSEAREAWLKVGSYLSEHMPERRKEDIGHMPDRRRHFGIPPDTKRLPKPQDHSTKKRESDNG
jgi:hypothetical protein